jgi:GABA permease
VRNPLRTEAEAFSFVLAAALCFLAVGIAAALGGAAAALAAVLSLGLGAGVGIYLTSDPREREPAVWARRPPDEWRRVLVLANEALSDRSLRDEVKNRVGPGSTEVLLVAPALDSRAPHWSAEEDARRAEASGRLDEAVAFLTTAGIEARGVVGDADPLKAIEQALRTFAADEVLIATGPRGKSSRLQPDVVASAREQFQVPVAHVVVDLEHERARQREPGSS